MCGFAGFLGAKNIRNKHLVHSILKKMNDRLIHRGPDSEGYWCNFDSEIFMSHRRLSIVDLSFSGTQPMISKSSEFTIVFNGEIYNHLEIRQEIKKINPGISWKGTSDTETLLASLDFFGIENTLKRLTGMFSFALWSNKTKTLTLARDRIGEKPLYYGWQGSGMARSFLFGSELKALREHPSFENSINRNSVNLFMKYNNVPAPNSIYKNIYKLMPGNFLQISLANQEFKIIQYWSLAQIASNAFNNPIFDTDNNIINNIESILKNTIKQQMIADVPIGAFLSGGIDSSSVVALMQNQSNQKINTFSIGFEEKNFDEAKNAMKIAKYLGTNHNELYVSSKEAMSIIPSLPIYYDEPFADSSQIPTFLVSRLAKKNVTVSLSGDGGDEVFGGYNRYYYADKYLNICNRLPGRLSNILKNFILGISVQTWSTIFSTLKINNNFGEKLYKVAKIIEEKNFYRVYDFLISNWGNPESFVLGTENNNIDSKYILDPPLQPYDSAIQLMILDMLNYLPNDILTKVDRASMGVSLETRLPFLNHELIEYMIRVPKKFKINNGIRKWALKKILNKYIPEKLVNRSKSGFAVPIDAWIRGPLREWTDSLINEKNIKSEGFLNYNEIDKKWKEHKSGKKNWHHELWAVLMFQSWTNKYL